MVAWIVVGPYGASFGPIQGVVSGAFIAAAAMHFGASYHLAYGDGVPALRKHPVGLVAAPLVIVAASVAVVVGAAAHAGWAEPLLKAMLTTVFTFTGWHYIKQAFGVGMLAARSGGLKPTRHEALFLRYALYPIWLYDVLEVWERGRNATYQRYDVVVGVVPTAAEPWIRGIGFLTLALALGLMVRIGLRSRTVPPLGLWGAYLTAGLWFLLPPTYVSAVVVLAGIHAVQYLTCAHRAEVDLAVERREQHLLHRWLCVFGGAAAGGLLLTNWLPDQATAAFATPGLPGAIPALVFIGFNLHHYAVDAVIWRSGGDHVVRMSRGPQPAPLEAEVVAAPVPAAPTPALA